MGCQHLPSYLHDVLNCKLKVFSLNLRFQTM